MQCSINLCKDILDSIYFKTRVTEERLLLNFICTKNNR